MSMDTVLQQFSFLEMIALAYMILYAIKVILILSNVNVAAATIHRKVGIFPLWAYVTTTSILCVLYTFVMLLPLLKRERFGFFFVYRNRQVMREVLEGL